MITKQILIDEIEIKFRKSKRAKNIAIRIKPIDGVIVTVPRLSTIKNAENFVYQKLSWIKKNLIKIQKLQKAPTVFYSNKDYFTKFHKFRISQSGDKFFINKTRESIIANFPNNTAFKLPEIQNQIRDLLIEVFREEAKSYLPERTHLLASQKELQFQKVTIRNTKTRWGSCSFKNNISLSLHLMRLPNELIDYVILHELAHTLIKNHSSDFWNTLEAICPNSKVLDKKLKSYNLNIF